MPAGSRISVAVFDAGPDQLGSPRIAQLAALIVLARRAEAAGVALRLGHPAGAGRAAPSEKVTEAGILRLLQARTPHEATDAQIARLAHAPPRLARGGRPLVRGSAPALGAVPGTRGASVLQVWDVLDPEAAAGGGEGPPRRRRRALARAITLELPDDAACARLLRDPFSAAVAPPRTGWTRALRAGLGPALLGQRLQALRARRRRRRRGLPRAQLPPVAGRRAARSTTPGPGSRRPRSGSPRAR